MIVDILAAVCLGLAIFKGISKGFVVALCSLVAWVIGLAAALKLSAVVAIYLERNTGITGQWLPFASFLIVFVIVVLVVRLLAAAVEKALQAAMLGWANRQFARKADEVIWMVAGIPVPIGQHRHSGAGFHVGA